MVLLLLVIGLKLIRKMSEMLIKAERHMGEIERVTCPTERKDDAKDDLSVIRY